MSNESADTLNAKEEAAALLASYLVALGYDDRGAEGEPYETAERVTSVLTPFIERRSAPILTDFPVDSNAQVMIQGLAFHSLCEHHLLPFFGQVDIAYVPDGRVAGFGGFRRVVNHFATRLQLQERMTQQIGDHLNGALNPLGLLVRTTAQQMCFEFRGGTPGVKVTTVATFGTLQHVPANTLFTKI